MRRSRRTGICSRGAAARPHRAGGGFTGSDRAREKPLAVARMHTCMCMRRSPPCLFPPVSPRRAAAAPIAPPAPRSPLSLPPRPRATQNGATNFHAVWDGWLLDTLATWSRQVEQSYAIRMDDDRNVSPPPSLFAQQLTSTGAFRHVADDPPADAPPPAKRMRHAEESIGPRGGQAPAAEPIAV